MESTSCYLCNLCMMCFTSMIYHNKNYEFVILITSVVLVINEETNKVVRRNEL